MAYVPDYIRPVTPKSPPSLPVTPTEANHTRRISSLTGNAKSPNSNGKVERPSSQVSEESNSSTSSPRRRSSTTPSYTPNRIFKHPQERVCSRVSIKDRLKSLESEAAVKLEVRQTAARVKRRSTGYVPSRPLQANASPDKDRQSEDNSSISIGSIGSIRSNRERTEKLGGDFSFSMPKPDIIASNQPKITDEMQLPEQKGIIVGKPSEQKDFNDTPHIANGNSETEAKSVKDGGKVKPSKSKSDDTPKRDNVSNPDMGRELPVAKDSLLSRELENKTTNRRTSEPIVPYCSSRENVDESIKAKRASRNSSSEADSANEKQKMETQSSKSSENVTLDSESNGKDKNTAGSGFKPIWRTPSVKQAQKTKSERLSSYVDDNGDKSPEQPMEKPTSLKLEERKTSTLLPSPEVTPVLDKTQEPSGAIEDTVVQKTAPLEEKDGSVSAIQPTTIADNSATSQGVASTTTYPVELRSPRHEHSGQAFRRQGTRDKRNARVFIMPSSSDSDMDNTNSQLTKMERDFAKLGLARAVDLLPDSVKVTQTQEPNHQIKKTPELTVKHVAPVKFVPNVLKAKESKEEKRDNGMEQSSKIYPELLAPPRSSRRDSRTHDGDLKKDSQKSPNRRRRSTRSSRSNASRSKSTDARRLGHDVHRHRSNSMCDPKRMRQGQEAVANAVTFGHHPDTKIPYIDDASSPIEENSATGRPRKPRRLSATTDQRAGDLGTIHRSNSADVLSSVAPEVSPAKLRRARASSFDRSAARSVHRRSYQIATMAREGDLGRQKNMDLNKFLHQTDQNGDGSRDSSLGDQDSLTRTGYLHYKVATIDKGKRTSSQKSWKNIWASLKDQQLCLTKDWSKTKSVQDSPLERQQSAQDEIQTLNVQSSLVGIAYNYLKRRNVFKLTTFNGSEYLFQAESRNDMLAWIAAIQKQSCMWNEDGNEGISEDLILRKTGQLDAAPKNDKRSMRKRSPKPSHKNNNLQVKDVDGSRRFKWRGSVTKIVKKFGTGQPFVMNGTFGVHLEDCPPSPSNEFVPFIVELCCRIVEERGLHFTGIYRVPGNNASLSALQEDLNNHGVESIQADDERLRELNVVSSLLKSFFRKLPEPLFTNELYHDFIQANRQPTPESRLNSLRKLVHMLPGPHYETLKFLISHLRLVADNCESNKMEVRNLAIVFGPTLVRNTAADNTATMVTDMSDQCRIIESIIDHAEWFFSDNAEPAPVPSLSSKETEKEHEVVPSIEFLLGNVGRKPGDTGTTESGKSKGSDDSENSFSRDLMDLIFGKKWKTVNANNQAPTVDDDGGFAAYRSKKLDDVVKKKEETNQDTVDTEATNLVPPAQSTSIPNVSEQLERFYREQLERLSQTTIGQTLPTFSSADSSPRTTPRHSTVFNSPILFPTQDTQPRVSNRSRVGSDSQDPRYVNSSYDVTPKIPSMEAVNQSLSVPQYKHPPNPYQHSIGSFHYSTPISEGPAVSIPAAIPVKPASVPVVRRNVPKQMPKREPQKFTAKHPTSPKASSRKSSRSDNVSFTDDLRLQNYPQIEPMVPNREMPVHAPVDENSPPSVNERLVDELPQPLSPTSPLRTRSRKSSSTSPEPPVSKANPKTRGHTKKSSTGSVNLPFEHPVQSRRKSPLKENFSVPLVSSASSSSSDKLFSRYDPKRRGIRFAGAENDQTSYLQNQSTNTTSPKRQQLTATERLFIGQPLRRRPSSRESRKNKVIRRHTLSGLQDLEAHSPSLRFKSNLQQASKGQNLSMYDLASANGSRSAMERLNPKGASTGMTLNNWIVQERLRNKTVQSIGSPGNSVRRSRENKGQFYSYV